MVAVGENSGKSSRSTAQLTAGPGAVAQRTGAAMSEIERAKLVSSLMHSCFQKSFNELYHEKLDLLY